MQRSNRKERSRKFQSPPMPESDTFLDLFTFCDLAGNRLSRLVLISIISFYPKKREALWPMPERKKEIFPQDYIHLGCFLLVGLYRKFHKVATLFLAHFPE